MANVMMYLEATEKIVGAVEKLKSFLKEELIEIVNIMADGQYKAAIQALEKVKYSSSQKELEMHLTQTVGHLDAAFEYYYTALHKYLNRNELLTFMYPSIEKIMWYMDKLLFLKYTNLLIHYSLGHKQLVKCKLLYDVQQVIVPYAYYDKIYRVHNENGLKNVAGFKYIRSKMADIYWGNIYPIIDKSVEKIECNSYASPREISEILAGDIKFNHKNWWLHWRIIFGNSDGD